MKKSLIALTAAMAVVAFNAVAHGDAKPLHGGIVQVASDLQFELVPQANGAALYIVDHGKPADASKMSGKHRARVALGSREPHVLAHGQPALLDTRRPPAQISRMHGERRSSAF